MILTKLGGIIVEKRVRAEDIAAATGLSIETIKNAKRGKTVSVSTATAIAGYLQVKREDLV